jgi:hypothetical protein
MIAGLQGILSAEVGKMLSGLAFAGLQGILSAEVGKMLSGLAPMELDLFQRRISADKLKKRLTAAEAKVWSDAVGDEIRTARELDLVLERVGDSNEPEAVAAVEAVTNAWEASLERLERSYPKNFEGSELELARALAESIVWDERKQAPAGYARAITGLKLEVRKEMVRRYQPPLVASTDERGERWLVEWGADEESYRIARASGQRVAAEEAHARVMHHRRLASEVRFLRAVNEETRAMRAYVRAAPTEAANAVLWCALEMEGDLWFVVEEELTFTEGGLDPGFVRVSSELLRAIEGREAADKVRHSYATIETYELVGSR